MDKETLSNYGWVVICVLVLCVMLALATPFGQYVATAVKNTTTALTTTADKQAENAGGILDIVNPNFEFGGNGESGDSINTNLATNTWEDVQTIVQQGKVAEAGWSVGDAKTVTIDGVEYTAILIGINHDSENSATFVVMGGLNNQRMLDPDAYNAGGWRDCELRGWLNDELYNKMDNKDQIKTVKKITNNRGLHGATEADLSETEDKVFLLSATEINNIDGNVVPNEGTVYEYFKTNIFKLSVSGTNFAWLRSPDTLRPNAFEVIHGESNVISGGNTNRSAYICPAFVIG